MPTILITGAASGIGRAAAVLFARRGWQCVLVDHNAQALADLLPILPFSHGKAHIGREVDLTQQVEIRKLADLGLFLDAIINNAGMSDTSGLPLVDQDSVQLERLLALNLQAPARMVEILSNRLLPGARVINVASGAGLRAIPMRGAYSPSKAGLIAQTRVLAKVRTDLTVTVLCPGFVRTELVDALIASGRLSPVDAVAKIPLGRMAEPQEMAEALFFLASAGARSLSGACLSVDGGSSVFGGSQAFQPAAYTPVSFEASVRFQLEACPSKTWEATLSRVQPDDGASGYVATIDFSALSCEKGQVLHAVHKAAARYAKCNGAGSSLTLLLPAEDGHDMAWQTGGDMAAARMLVATLACELGPQAMRINAIEIDKSIGQEAIVPLLAFVGGARAQFLTGQIIRARA